MRNNRRFGDTTVVQTSPSVTLTPPSPQPLTPQIQAQPGTVIQVTPQENAYTAAQLQTQIVQLEQAKQAERIKQSQLDAQISLLSSRFQVKSSGQGGDMLNQYLKQFLPKRMQPGNVGDYDNVVWPFWFPLDFDIGTDPVINSNLLFQKFTQITADGAFLLLSISLDAASVSESGLLAPLQVDIRDNQSSRQFNDRPIPIQNFGTNSRPAYLPTPYLFQPNATIQMNLTSWIPKGINMSTTGSGVFQFLLGGLRIRTESDTNVTTAVMGASVL